MRAIGGYLAAALLGALGGTALLIGIVFVIGLKGATHCAVTGYNCEPSHDGSLAGLLLVFQIAGAAYAVLSVRIDRKAGR
jgi:hypothetical protein